MHFRTFHHGHVQPAIAIVYSYLLLFRRRIINDLVYSSFHYDSLNINQMKLFKFFIIGLLFGFVLVKSEVISWFRIQEMFRFESFHMYGVMITAMAVGIISIFLIKKFNAKTISG